MLKVFNPDIISAEFENKQNIYHSVIGKDLKFYDQAITWFITCLLLPIIGRDCSMAVKSQERIRLLIILVVDIVIALMIVF